MRKLLRHIIEVVVALTVMVACHPIEEFERDNEGDFEALWTAVDEHYCFFEEKDVDWREAHDRYRPMVNNRLSRTQLFEICANMLGELKDGHTNLSSGFETSYYRQWWSDYPQNFDLRLIQEHYFNFNYKQLGNVIYGMLPENVGYVYIPSFSTGLSASNIDWILSDLIMANGLIIDLRDNGGGNLSDAEAWARHFIMEPITAGYMRHKTGPGHDELSDPYPIEIKPLGSGNLVWMKPVVILTNRSTFSAANYLVMVMRSLPQVTHAGATTGGGSGMPLTLELPGGWAVRMSAVSILDAQGQVTESGIRPDEGCETDMDPVAASAGIDTMLEFAISLIR